MNYKIDPGIYAIGNPDSDSYVFVSSNYKMSFDILRKSLKGLNAWILVLDTKGVNVWCSAGKGTFGTQELVSRIKTAGLEKIVVHRKLILPQFAAPGVAAHKVKQLSGFNVIYGPVRASDIQAFIKAGMKATPEMRQVRFNMLDRMILIPMEALIGIKYIFIAAVIFTVLETVSKATLSFHSAGNLLLAYVAGTVISPLLLPWIPGRSFSLKGFYAGAMMFLIIIAHHSSGINIMEMLSWLLIIPAVSSFMAMNFTGASTYTSISGVKKEMKIALPMQISAVVMGTVLWITERFVS